MMTFEEAKRVSVYDLCVKFGAKRVQVSNAKQYALFHAPYRTDRHPSFKVDLAENRWYDLAENVGGDAVDLVRRQLGYTTSREALQHLAHEYGGNYAFSYKKQTPIKKENLNRVQPCVVTLQNKVLLDYVASRAVSPALAKRYCMEAHRVSKKTGKPYYALAFPSLSGGYELRNPGLKGAEGPKDISIVGSGYDVFLFFEGVFDFMSHVQLYGCRADATYFVLNTTALADRAASYVAALATVPAEVQLWLDNDEAGRAATAVIRERLPNAKDMSYVYDGFADLNEYLMFNR